MKDFYKEQGKIVYEINFTEDFTIHLVGNKSFSGAEDVHFHFILEDDRVVYIEKYEGLINITRKVKEIHVTSKLADVNTFFAIIPKNAISFYERTAKN